MVLEHDYKNFPELTNNQLETLRFNSPHPQIEEDFDAEVVKVHDGDTLTIHTSFRDFDFPLRLLDIDAPEMNEGGETARDWLRGRLLNKRVRVLIDVNNRVGKFGRLLGKIFHRGMDSGQEMLSLGLVVPFGSKDEFLPVPISKLLRLGQWF